MPKTKVDLVTAALRHLGVISAGDPADAADYALGIDALDGIAAEMTGTQGVTMPADLNATPDGLYLPLSRLIAVEIAPHYGIAPEMRSRAVMRLRSALIDSDIKDRRDTDDDGVISDAEAQAGLRSQYY